MTITFDIWQFLTLLGVFLATSAGLGKIILLQHQRHVDAQFVELKRSVEEGALTAEDHLERIHKVELQMRDLTVEMQRRFVEREDYIRGQTVIEAKLDALYSRLQLLQIEGAQSHGK